MPNVKTAISIPAELFKQVDRYSKKKRIPRSQIFAEGARRVLRQQRDEQITHRLNKVFKDPKVRAEQSLWARAAAVSLAEIMKRQDQEW
jgi:metal-responsive CopG/Arc/MetJ family transcriptional regulator